MKPTAARLGTLACAVLLGLAVHASPGRAQIHVGPQLSLGEESDLGIGGRVAVYDLGDSETFDNWEGVGSVDVFFPGDDVSYWELNFNGIYNFPLGEGTPLFPYLGGGLNVARTSFEDADADSDLGLNLLAGWKYRAESMTPFGEVRVELGGGEQLVVSGGILLP